MAGGSLLLNMTANRPSMLVYVLNNAANLSINSVYVTTNTHENAVCVLTGLT